MDKLEIGIISKQTRFGLPGTGSVSQCQNALRNAVKHFGIRQIQEAFRMAVCESGKVSLEIAADAGVKPAEVSQFAPGTRVFCSLLLVLRNQTLESDRTVFAKCGQVIMNEQWVSLKESD